MTVSELMAILRDQDPDAKVYIMNLISGIYVTPVIDTGDTNADAVLIDCGDYD
jgi:hypothetical protein